MKTTAADLPFHRLPPEIWLQILSLVARPTADQLTYSTDTYDGLSTQGYSQNTYMNQKEESELIQQRSTLAMVCKTWYPIANALLWSHVRLILNTSTKSLKGILKTMMRSPRLAHFITRLTIREVQVPYVGRETYESSNELDLWELLGYLTSLRVIVYPSTYRLADHITGVEIAFVYNSITRMRRSSQNFVDSDTAFQQLRMLAVTWDKLETGRRRVLLPMLENIHITLSSEWSGMYSLKLFDMPRLRAVSLECPNVAACFDFLSAVRSKVEYLRISTDVYGSNSMPPVKPFTHLTSIFIAVYHESHRATRVLTTLIRSIDAPQLQCIGFYNIRPEYHSMDQLIACVNIAIDAYCSSLDTIHLESSAELIQKGGTLLEEAVKNWCEDGFEVNVRSGTTWTVYTA